MTSISGRVRGAPALEVVGVRRRFGAVPALRGVDLSVQRGEIVSLLGPNGAGKSTLVSIVAGLIRPDAGAVRVRGMDAVTHASAVRADIGLAPQDLGIYPVVTVRDNLTLFGSLAGLRGAQLRRHIADVAAALLLEDLLDRVAGTLSGGQQRRLHTAIAVLHRPPVVLLDEPTAGADVQTRAALLELVRGLAAAGAAVVYSTHYLPEVERLGGRVAVLHQGRIVADSPTAELTARGAGQEVEFRFVGPAPVLHLPHLSDALVRTARDTIRVIGAEPGTAIGSVTAALGRRTERLRSVRVVQPDLETVYLSLTTGPTTTATVPTSPAAPAGVSEVA